MKVEGTLLEDPYLSYTPTGKVVTTFKVLNTGTEEKPEWETVRAVAWEDFAVRCNENLRKDFKVRLFGNEKERWWTTPEGEKRSTKEFNVYRVQVLK